MAGVEHHDARAPKPAVISCQEPASFADTGTFLDSGCVPHHWKESTTISIPKKSHPKDLNDFRQVALISVLGKCVEGVVCDHLSSMVAERVDPLQFAYKAKRGVEDACLTLLDTVGNQLD